MTYHSDISGCRIVVITPASQAGDGGSIPLTRSILLALCLAFCQPSIAALPATLDDGTPLPSLAPVVEEVLPAVVNIETFNRVRLRGPLRFSPFGGFYSQPREARRMASAGSGVIIDAARGYILTNYHVVESAQEIQVNLKDRRAISAGMVGFDRQVDIAVLQIDAKNLAEITRGDSDDLSVGDFVLAVGNPFRFDSTVTSGIISALGRGSGTGGYQDFIQTDASINSGNSGGPLVDLAGRLVGINTAIHTPSGGSVGIGFAIPSNLAIGIAEELIASGTIRRGNLGLWIEELTLDEREALGVAGEAGVLITRVTPGSLADDEDIMPSDLLVRIDGRTISDASDYASSAGLFIIGQTVALELIRDAELRTVRVEIVPPRSVPVEGRRVDARFHGTTLQNFLDEDATESSSLGVIVTDIRRGSHAWNAGFRAGDILTSAGRLQVRDIDDLLRGLQNSGSDAVIGVYRSGSRGTITLRALPGV